MMEEMYEDIYTYPVAPTTKNKPTTDNKRTNSRISLAAIIVISICLLISVACLVYTATLHSALKNQLEDLSTKLNEAVPSLSDENSTEVTVLLQETQQSMQNLSNEVASYHHIEVKISCPSGYMRNPYANSCIKLVQTGKSWTEAKSSCESAGRRLATFETLESQYWFITLRQTVWKTGVIWVGGQKLSAGVWSWLGETPKPATIVLWAQGEPNNAGGIEDCMVSQEADDKGPNYMFNDYPCDSNSLWYICELII